MANFDRKEQVQKEFDEELEKWHKLGMKVQGVPTAYMQNIPIPGLPVELLELEARLEAVCTLLLENFSATVTVDKLNIYYKEYLIKRLKATREANEDAIREARAAQTLQVAKAQILGPNGTPMKPIRPPSNNG